MIAFANVPKEEKLESQLRLGAGFQNASPALERIGAAVQAMPIADLSRYAMACLVGGAAGLVCLISPWIALVLVAGAIFLGVALSKPVGFCYLLIITIATTSGIERGRFIPLLMPNEVILLLAVGITLATSLLDKRRQMGDAKYFISAFILLVGGVVFIPIVAYLEQGTELTMNNAFKVAAPLQYFLLFWLFAVAPRDETDRRRVIALMLVCGGLVAVVGLLQAVGVGFVINLLENFYSSSHEEMAANAGRVTSLLGAWNSLGIFMMFNFLIGLIVLPEISRPIVRICTLGLMALCALCLVASGSYAGILGLLIGILLSQALARRKMRAVPILIVCCIGVVIALLFFEPLLQPLIDKRLAYQFREGGMVPQTLTFRFEVWRDVFLPPILEHMPWPVYPTVPISYAWQYEESQYILLLFRTGLSGFLGFLGWLALTVGWLYRRLHTSDGFTGAIATATLTIIITLAIAGLTNEVFSFSGSTDYLWMMLGLVANGKGRLS